MGNIKYIWLFLFGVVIIVVGMYFLLGKPSGIPDELVAPRSFMIMMVGLMVTGVGAVYGRNRIRMIDSSSGPRKEEETVIVGLSEKEKVEAPIIKEVKAETAITRLVAQDAQVQAKDVAQEKPQEKSEGKPKKVVIKVLICPSCGTENQEKSKFCYECGQKIRKF